MRSLPLGKYYWSSRSKFGGDSSTPSIVGTLADAVLSATAENRNTCEIRTPVRDGAGRVIHWAVERATAKVNGVKRLPGQEMASYHSVVFSTATREQIEDIECILDKRDDSRAFLRQWYAARRDAARQNVMAEFEGTISCDIDGNTMYCDGEICSGDGWRYSCEDDWWNSTPPGGEGPGAPPGGGGGQPNPLDPLPPDWEIANSGNAALEPPPSLSEDANTWSFWAHNYFLDAAFEDNGCPAIVSTLKASSLIGAMGAAFSGVTRPPCSAY